MKPIIAIDVDDVLAHSTEAFRLIVNAKAGTDLTAEDYKVPGEYHKYYERVWTTQGISDRVPKHELFAQMSVDQTHILPYSGADEALRNLAHSFDLVVVTARAPEWQAATKKWLHQNFPDVFSAVHFAGNRRDPSGKSKGDLCTEIGASYLIDDNPEHALSALEQGVVVLLFGNYGWHINIPDGVIHCETWKDVERYFDDKSD